MKKRTVMHLFMAGMLLLPGCGAVSQDTSDFGASGVSLAAETTSAEARSTEQVSVDTSDMFTDRDMEIGYDEESSAVIELKGTDVSADSDAVTVADGTVTISDEGTYILSGTLEDGMILVEAEDTDKVQLVLNGVNISNSDSAAIYVRSADKVFITTTSGSDNTISNGGEYQAIDDNNIDGTVFSKSDLTLNGEGTLTINADAGHGIVSKDDLVLTSGTYDITAAGHGLSGKDSVRIANGTYTIVSGKDGIHASNTDDSSLGFVYIAGGTMQSTAEDDGIHADSAVILSGGSIEIANSYEGIEGMSIDITGGEITVNASDDGLNAAGGNDESGFEGGGGDQFAAEEGAYIHISGGILQVSASGDGIDSNGELTVSGGETYVSGPTDSGNGALDYNGEAVITGGIFVAAGSSGMAQNFGTSSTQGAMLVTIDSQTAGSSLSLCDSEGNELLSWQPQKAYSSVLISCPEVKQSSSYTLTAGNSTTEITMDSLIYGNGGGMGDGRMSGGMKPGSGGKRP